MPPHIEICPECSGEGLCTSCSGWGCLACAYLGDCEHCGGTRYLEGNTALYEELRQQRTIEAFRRTLLKLCHTLNTPTPVREQAFALLDTLGTPNSILEHANNRLALVWHHQGLEVEIDLV